MSPSNPLSRKVRSWVAVEQLEDRWMPATVTINSDLLTIVGDDANPNAFYGTPFVARVTEGMADFYVAGNLSISDGDHLVGVGSKPIRLFVGNNLTIPGRASIDVSAVGSTAGVGGGTGGQGGIGGEACLGGQGGPGGSGGSGGQGGSGGVFAGGTGSNGSFGSRGSSSNVGTAGRSGTNGSAGQNGFGLSSGGAGGTTTICRLAWDWPRGV